MLKKENRLKKKSAFNATYKTGKALRYNGITVFCGKHNSLNVPTKIGFVVSKKIHKRAVKRNRIKRLMRESMRLYIKKGCFNNKYVSLIFTPSDKILNKNFNYVNDSIIKLMEML